MCARTWRTANADRHVRSGPRWHARGWLEQYSLKGSTSKSAVSRRFVKTTETALAELRTSGLDLVALMIDEVRFASTPAPSRSASTSRASSTRCRR